MNSTCPICNGDVSDAEDRVVLREKGSVGINKASEDRNDSIKVNSGDIVHKTCRQTYTNKLQIAIHLKKCQEKENIGSSHRSVGLRSSEQTFNIQQQCLFCGVPAKYDGKKRGFGVIPVRTTDFDQSIMEVCVKRNDQWAESVRNRLLSVHDLHAADAVYHQDCSTYFRTGKQVPPSFASGDKPSQRKCGRPHDVVRAKAFEDVVRSLEENDDEQTTIADLINRMKDKLLENNHPDIKPYGFTHMKNKLKEYFGNKIIITDVNGKPNVITFYSTASATLQQFYEQQRNEDTEKEKLRLVEAAAKIIKNDIKSLSTSNETYPNVASLSLDDAVTLLPDSVKTFLTCLISGKNTSTKLASLGQALMQAARPRVLTLPLQLGLAVQMHHHFGSRFLNDTLNKMGFAASYDEVKKYECSAAASHCLNIPDIPESHFIQFSADNVDHNTRTLDGLNTFHGMGMIAMITPGINHRKPVPKLDYSAEDIAAAGHVQLYFYNAHPNMSQIFYRPLPLEPIHEDDKLDVIHSASLLFKSPRPSWSGMMQAVHSGEYPEKSSTVFLPMIDMDPSNMSCIYSTLKFICSQARKLHVTPVLTFDQPLWFKALMIVENEPENSDIKQVVLRLGGLHVEMSFLGCIGHVMAGSGLQELLEVIYAETAVQHILSGKAISRAIRAHFIVDSVLNAMLISTSLADESSQRNAQVEETNGEDVDESSQMNSQGIGTNTEENESSQISSHTEETNSEENEESSQRSSNVEETHTEENELLNEVSKVYEDLLTGIISVEGARHNEFVVTVTEKIEKLKSTMQSQKTAQLWLIYMEMVAILKRFIKAERLGEWALHLEALREMLPFLAAAGHNLYTKSIRLYLQKMSELKHTHPDIHQKFESGHHVVRRSNRYWAGLSTDLIIEQVLMRSVKTTGGLTRGRGMSEKQRLVWLLSMPTCTEVNCAMQDFTGIQYYTSDQHKEMGKSRQVRDTKDTAKVRDYLAERNPFHTDDSSLRNIATGVTATKEVNVCDVKQIGRQVLNSMTGKSVDDYVFKRKDQVIPMSVSSSVTIEEERVHVDPQLLFQRLLTVARATENDLIEAFRYELCSIPPSLFESNGLLRPANKPALADAIWKLMINEITVPQDDVQFVLDGGALLQGLPWSKGQTYESLCQMYVQHIQKSYGLDSTTVVFDGYPDRPTTKDHAHLRRSKGMKGAKVHFTEDMVCNSKKHLFLSNHSNKQNFIKMLGAKLQASGCTVLHAEEDADRLIATTAVESSLNRPTIAVADDTDVLILLIHYAQASSQGLFLQHSRRITSKKHGSIWNILKVRHDLGEDVCRHILFTHAFLGCDTTSGIFGLGKAVALKKVKQSDFSKHAAVFSDIATKRMIEESGEAALLSLYGHSEGNLNCLRYQKFCEKVATNPVFVEPKSLPPTSSAARYHSFRVYYQVQQWMGRQDIDACDWGWEVNAGRLSPTMSDLKPAPQYLLNIIRCSCKSDCRTKRCTCRKLGLTCSNVCGGCNGTSCTNTPQLDLED